MKGERETRLRGFRGATSVEENSGPAIRITTRTLLERLVEANGLAPADLVSAIFTVTPDLNAEFPAAGARELGWHDVPLLCATEIAVPHAEPRIIRVLLHAYTALEAGEIRHVYLGRAVGLRPDLNEH